MKRPRFFAYNIDKHQGTPWIPPSHQVREGTVLWGDAVNGDTALVDLEKGLVLCGAGGWRKFPDCRKLRPRRPLKGKQLGDTWYEFSRALRAGAWAYWRDVPCYCNPHRDGSQKAYDWDAGHELAAAGDVTRAEIGPEPGKKRKT